MISAHFIENICNDPLHSNQSKCSKPVHEGTHWWNTNSDRDKLGADPALGERTSLPIDKLIEMLTFSAETTYFETRSDIYRQEEWRAVESPL